MSAIQSLLLIFVCAVNFGNELFSAPPRPSGVMGQAVGLSVAQIMNGIEKHAPAGRAQALKNACLGKDVAGCKAVLDEQSPGLFSKIAASLSAV